MATAIDGALFDGSPAQQASAEHDPLTVRAAAPAAPAAVLRPDPARPLAAAAARVFGAGAGLAGAGLAGLAFVGVRLVETWRVTPRASTHRVTIFGHALSYPSANVDALVVLGLALVALAATLRGVVQAGREALGAARLHRSLGQTGCGEHAGALLVADVRPLAFCAGLLRPRVYVSTGALARLDPDALAAVIAHERHHAQRRDPLRIAAGRVFGELLFFVPGLRGLASRQRSLAELSADEGAIHAALGSRSGLARAMLTFSDAPNGPDEVGFAPARVDYLLGRSPDCRFPALLCLAAVAVIATLVTVTFLAGRVASGSATLAPPFLSRQPCIVALAAVPAVAALLVSAGRRRRD
jgi:hypothetical protein